MVGKGKGAGEARSSWKRASREILQQHGCHLLFLHSPQKHYLVSNGNQQLEWVMLALLFMLLLTKLN